MYVTGTKIQIMAEVANAYSGENLLGFFTFAKQWNFV